MQLLFSCHVYSMMKQLSVFIFMILFILACANKNPGDGNENAGMDVIKLFRTHCVTCHGADGKLGDNGAKDLTKSPLTLRERMVIIKEGKNVMTKFGDVLSKEEIEALAKYTLRLN